MLPEIERIADETGASHVVAWVEAELGGEVIELERIPRWRFGWYLRVRRDDEILDLYARGERGADFPSPFTLEHEARVHALFEANGVPVPHVYGVVEGPIRTLVMDRVPGQQGLALAVDDETRRSLFLTYIEHLVRVHQIDTGELAHRGFNVPTEAAAIAMSDVFRIVEEKYLALDRRDPPIEFLRSWLCRNLPRHRDTPAFVTWDAAQFLHHDGEVTALIDFELAHVGDPYMDLSTFRTRDSIEPLGDLNLAFARYAELTGVALDFELLRYYEISQLTVTLMLQYPVVIDPDPTSDYVTHLIWYTDSARYALDILAERLGTTLDSVAVPPSRPSGHATAHQHLVTSLRTASAPGDFVTWRTRCAYRLARHLLRVDEIGEAVARENDDDVRQLLGAPADDAEDEARLLAFITAAGAEQDEALLKLFARRMQRLHMLLGPSDSLIVRHAALQPLPS